MANMSQELSQLNTLGPAVEMPWVEFQTTKSGALNITVDPNDTAPRYFVSLQYNKNGTGVANTFTLNLAFIPKSNEDPNKVENALFTDGLNIKMRYGYSYPNAMTSWYTGQITGYSTSIDNGRLSYSITGYSGFAGQLKDTNRIVYQSIPYNNETKISDRINDVYNDYFKGLGYSKCNIATDDAVISSKNKIEASPNTTPIDYLYSLVSKMKYQGDTDNTGKTSSSTTDSVYEFYLDDADMSFNVVRINPSDTNNNVISDLVFDWMSSDKYNIISFSLDYNGIAMITRASSQQDNTKRYGIDSSGTIIGVGTTPDDNYYSSKSITTGNNMDDETSTIKRWWDSVTNYPIQATLVVRGLVGEYHIMDQLKVTPLFYGKPHLSAGIYYILSQTDNIDSSGFTTTFKLIKKIDPSSSTYNYNDLISKTLSEQSGNTNEGESSTS